MQFVFRGMATALLGSHNAAPIHIGTPVGSYHNFTLQVYSQVLRDMGHEVKTTTNIPHKDMYPHFTGAEGAERYIDMVVSSDLPVNHAEWLEKYQSSFSVVGTCYEFQSIFLAVPSDSGIKAISELKGSKVNRTIIGFDIDPCAKCPELVAKWIKEELGEGFSYLPMSEAALKDTLKSKLAAKEVFATTFWSPSYWNALFPQLQKLDMGKFAAGLGNQGKALVSTASPLVTDPKNAKTLRALSAVFIGDSELTKADYKIFQVKQKGGEDAANAEYIVAQQWIQDNRRLYDMFFW